MIYSKPHFDDDGYPTEDFLEWLKNYNTFQESQEDLLDEIEAAWWLAEWGFRKHKDKEQTVLFLHTGGWSGNESIISSLEGNLFFWHRFYDSHHAGGHYYFKGLCKSEPEVTQELNKSKKE